jgi:hypothetical protein
MTSFESGRGRDGVISATNFWALFHYHPFELPAEAHDPLASTALFSQSEILSDDGIEGSTEAFNPSLITRASTMPQQ